MVRAQYVHTDTGCCLQVTGHAGSAPKGADLVCSAVSILIYTAAQRALELYTAGMLCSWPMIQLESGKSLVLLTIRAEHVGAVQLAMDTVLTGLQLLAKQYPQYITVDQPQNGD